MNLRVITLFPELFSLPDHGVLARALKKGTVRMETIPLRSFSSDPFHGLDDRPFGGGPGMVLQPEPLQKALETAKAGFSEPAKGPKACRVVVTSPQGQRFDQAAARAFSQEKNLIFVAGRYEGIDERFLQQEGIEEWSIGDYVLSGGELAVWVMIDAAVRLIPGVLGDSASASEDSFGPEEGGWTARTTPGRKFGVKKPFPRFIEWESCYYRALATQAVLG